MMSGRPPAKGTSARGAVTDTRVAALRICEDLRAGALLDIAFERYATKLDSRNRRWLQQLVYGMLRARSRLDYIIESRVNGGIARINPTLLDLLRLGAYQLLYMGGVPSYAAIAQSVELAKEQHGHGAGSLVNAVLRRMDRERESIFFLPSTGSPVELLALEFSHPAWLVSRWVDAYGAEDARRLLAANNSEPAIYARPMNVSSADLAADLTRSGAYAETAPLVPDGARLSGGVALSELASFRRGWFFVQDPAATLVAHYASVPRTSTVLDLCAAPGGKALELSLSAGAVFAGDRSFTRIARMKENLLRLNSGDVELFVADANQPPFREAEVVLLDVPCTGTGTFRRHPDARWRMKISDIAVMAAAQRNLLRAAASVVRPGGLLVYSTCSLEPEENEIQVDHFLADNPEWILEPPADGAVPETTVDRGYLRVLPHKHGVDGAFAARLRKRA